LNGQSGPTSNSSVSVLVLLCFDDERAIVGKLINSSNNFCSSVFETVEARA